MFSDIRKSGSRFVWARSFLSFSVQLLVAIRSFGPVLLFVMCFFSCLSLRRLFFCQLSFFKLSAAVLALVAVIFAGTDAAYAKTPAPSPTPEVGAGASKGAESKAAAAFFGIRPSTATAIDTRTAFSIAATPGARLTDHVAVYNLGQTPLTLQIYATDAQSTSNGEFTLRAGNEQAQDLGSWITIGTPSRQILVPARTADGPSIVYIPFTLAVPANATPGDHVAGILASLVTEGTNPQGNRVNLDQRVAARVYLRVSGPIHPKLSVQAMSVSFTPTNIANPIGTGDATVSYTLKNTGNVILGASQSVGVSGLFGGTHKAAHLSDIPALFPGSSVRIVAKVSGVFPSFRLTGTAHITPIPQPNAVDPEVKQTSTSVTIWALPWALLALIALLLIIAAGIFFWRRRASDDKQSDDKQSDDGGPDRDGSEPDAKTPKASAD